MRAAVVDTVPGTVGISEVVVDEPRFGEVLVRTVATGVCHSDLHAMHGHGIVSPSPFVLGHEPAGVVEAIGPGVHNVKPGDHVVACLSVYCGHCANCLTGHPYRCFTDDDARAADAPARLTRDGETVHQFVGVGGFGEHMLVSQHHLVAIDKALPLERACLLGCGVLTGVGAALNTTPVRAGSSVAVIGCGGVGISVIQGARLAHARRIVAVDVDDAKLELARRCGATDVVNARNDDAVAAVQQLLRGGADFVFEAIGSAATIQQALGMAGVGGSVTVVGIPGVEEQVTISGIDLLMGKSIRQSLMGSNRFVADIPLLAGFALDGLLDLDAMVSLDASLDDLPKVLDDLEVGNVLGRAVITFA
jgi:S-(hydroxymethyl)glutathione dehydrogenase/alcohol dehydrogenase